MNFQKMKDKFKLWKIDFFEKSEIKFEFIEQNLTIYGLNIKFKADNLIYSIEFKRYISFRISDESTLLEYWDILPNNSQDYPFFHVENSTFIKELKLVSKDFFTGPLENTLKHYCIFFENDCIEVISDITPKIVIIKN